MKTSALVLACLYMPFLIYAQNHVQTFRGTIFEQETLTPLTGANIMIENTDLGTSTDLDGHFEIKNVPIGRQNIVITYLGYEPVYLNNILITTGKELVLDIGMTESLISMEEVVVRVDQEKAAPLNEMALSSARSFSVEETGRYASSLFDPARMAMNFAGVSTTGGSSDLFNEIIVRGNSPRGVLWRLEGIEIPNPNHFGGIGSSGGGISMLSSSLISTSDFYTGAFPAEFGDAISGAFDLKLRKGNNEKREHSFMLGILGTEIATEGPIGKPGDGSYLVNFRYSTLGMLQKIGLNPAGDVLPEYGDLSFNVYLPKSSWGTFNIFGLSGKNRAYFKVESDSTKWIESDDDYGFNERQTVGTIGISHKLLLDDKRYLHTVFAASTDQNSNDDYHLDPTQNYRKIKEFENRFNNQIYRLSSTYNHKLNAKNSYKIGIIGSYHHFDFYARDFSDNGETFTTYLQDSGFTTQLNSFIQWKYRLNENWTTTGGLHFNYFGLTKKSSIEPRFALKWQADQKQALHLALGLHSKPEHPVFYFIESSDQRDIKTLPNRNLDYIKSFHAVLGYDFRISSDLRFNTELYYQYLYDVPVEKDPSSVYSILNSLDVWDMLSGNSTATNDGKGKNYGIDISMEKSFSNSYYFLLSGSLFNSRFSNASGKWYNTRFNSQYQTNLLAGKEIVMGKNKNKIFGMNGKMVLNGGNRTTPINLEASREAGHTVRDKDLYLANSVGSYYRLDVGVSYKIIKTKTTHSLMLDIQNVTNHLNHLEDFYNRSTDQIEYTDHTGLFPVLNYRIEF
ncbi:MAG: TonB-dependent receptor [Saprospiraceae bacterium]|nr:TonB-dependent receptor [Saprospiraceae bacterium]